MTSLETIRKKNIERNKEILKQLQLDKLGSLIDPPVVKPKTRLKLEPKVTKTLPIRRSKRLTRDSEDEKEREFLEEQAAKELLAQQQLRESRLSKLVGDFSVRDLLAEPKSGQLSAEDTILGAKQSVGQSNSNVPADVLHHLSVFQEMGVSIEKGNNAPLAEVKGHDMSPSTANDGLSLRLHSLTDPSRIKLTPHRITSILFHPSSTNRLAFAGDTNGSLGIWCVDQKTDDDIPVVLLLKPHGRNISRIVDVPSKPIHLITGSYDGSCRVMDLSKQAINEIVSIEDEMGSALGISDISCSSQNMLYATTLTGLLLQHDMREHHKQTKYKNFLRLHDKKIGGFSVNPLCEHQIATSSLDRTLKLWDLRKISKNPHSEIVDGLSSPQCFGGFTSRLSISTVDWNLNQRLVCNGYDDTIRIFDVQTPSNSRKRTKSRGDALPNDLKAQQEIGHNCQTGRWVSILKSKWQRSPKDGLQKFAVGNMNRSIDIYAENGQLIANLNAPALTAVPAVVSFHPTANWVLGGTSSGKVFLFN